MRLVVPSLLLIAAALPAAEPADHVAPPLIVTADREELDPWRTTASANVVSAQDLHDRGQVLNLWQYPAGLPGVDSYASGGGVDGGIAGIRLRGSSAADTLILLDGIPVQDATDPKMAPNLALFDASGIESVEIVRGAQSGLYGSGAVGGVAGFRTARPTAVPEVAVNAAGGSFGTARLAGTVTGPLGDGFGYAVTAGGTRSDGISSQTTRDDGRTGDHERDAVARGSGTARVEAYPTAGVTLYMAGRYEAANQDSDGYLAPDDEEPQAQQRTWRVSAGGTAELGAATLTLDAARTGLRRTYEPGEDRYSGVNDYAAGRVSYDLLRPEAARGAFDRATIAAGIDASRDAADIATAYSAIDESERMLGAYAQTLIGGSLWEATLAGRGDDHSREGRNSTWRAGAALFPIEALKLHGSAGSAFRAPSLFQLHDPSYGNEDLESQLSRSRDLGLTTRPVQGLEFDVTAFRTDYTQDIGYDPATYQSINTGGYRLDGIESGLTWNPAGDGPRLAASFTTQRTDGGTKRHIPLLPRNKALIQPGWDLDPVWFTLRIEASGERYSGTEQLPGYALIGAASGWRINHTWEVYARGENLLGAAYMLYPGYSTPGASGYAGVNATF